MDWRPQQVWSLHQLGASRSPQNWHGLPHTTVMMTTESIKKGDQILWNYASRYVKIEKNYIVFRQREIEEFVQEKELEYQDGQINKNEKINYILETPQALFILLLKTSISLEKWTQLREHPIASKRPPSDNRVMNIMYDIVKKWLLLRPHMAESLTTYLIDVYRKKLEEEGIHNGFNIIFEHMKRLKDTIHFNPHLSGESLIELIKRFCPLGSAQAQKTFF